MLELSAWSSAHCHEALGVIPSNEAVIPAGRAGGPEVHGHPRLHGESEACLGYTKLISTKQNTKQLLKETKHTLTLHFLPSCNVLLVQTEPKKMPAEIDCAQAQGLQFLIGARLLPGREQLQCLEWSPFLSLHSPRQEHFLPGSHSLWEDALQARRVHCA